MSRRDRLCLQPSRECGGGCIETKNLAAVSSDEAGEPDRKPAAFAAARKLVREALIDAGVAPEIEEAVRALLSLPQEDVQ